MSLIDKIRVYWNREKAMHDGPQETKVVADAIAPSALSKPEPPRFVDSQRNADYPDTKKWAVLNRPHFETRSRAITYVTRSKSGAPMLIRRDLETREIVSDDNDSFALGRND